MEHACADGELPPDEVVRDWLAATFAHVAGLRNSSQPPGGVEVAVRIVDADEGRSLNRAWRDRDYPTNVLSFPAEQDGLRVPADELLPLGDIVLCAPVVRCEAARQHKPPANHWAHLLVHGMLHLLGYDHRDRAETAQMEALETEILAAGGLPDPYA